MKKKFKHIKWANISISHLPTTGAIILYDIIKGNGVEYQPFTTTEKAFAWIGLSNDDFDKFKMLK